MIINQMSGGGGGAKVASGTIKINEAAATLTISNIGFMPKKIFIVAHTDAYYFDDGYFTEIASVYIDTENGKNIFVPRIYNYTHITCTTIYTMSATATTVTPNDKNSITRFRKGTYFWTAIG